MFVRGCSGSRLTFLVTFEPYDNVIQGYLKQVQVHLKMDRQKRIRTNAAICTSFLCAYHALHVLFSGQSDELGISRCFRAAH